jgi:hypothetical protein
MRIDDQDDSVSFEARMRLTRLRHASALLLVLASSLFAAAIAFGQLWFVVAAGPAFVAAGLVGWRSGEFVVRVRGAWLLDRHFPNIHRVTNIFMVVFGVFCIVLPIVWLLGAE